MNRTESLRDLLADLARVFNRGESIDVEFTGNSPHAALDGDHIAVNPAVADWYGVDDIDRANAMRLLRDTVSHEVEHIRSSDLRAKQAIVNDVLPDGATAEDPSGASREEQRNAKVAAQVYNIAEDAYINHRRCSDRPGLRATFAYKAQLLAGDDDVSEMPRGEAILAGIQQTSLLGTVHGYESLDHDLRRLFAFMREHLDAYRRTDDADERAALARRMSDAAIAHMPAVPERPDELEDLLDALQDASLTAQNDPDDMPDAEPMDAEDLPDPDELEDEDLPDPDELEADVDGDAGDAQNDESGEDGTESDDGDDSQSRGGSQSDADGDEAEADAEDAGESPTDPDALADTMDAMRDEDGRNEWHNVNPDRDVSEPGRADERRAERLQDRQDFRTETHIGTRMRSRDTRARHLRDKGTFDGQVSTGHSCEKYEPSPNGDLYPDAGHEHIRDILRETGLARDVRRAFERFKSEDVTVAAENGETLNTDRVIDHMAGDYGEQAVYDKRYTSATGGRTIGVALDASGSMNENGEHEHGAMVDAKVALGALHLAAHEMGDDIVASAFHGFGKTDLLTAPDESFEWEHLDATTAGGKTPTAHGILDVADLLDRAGGRELVMLVVTDGNPKVKHGDLCGNSYCEDASIAANMARADGIKVIGVGVGDDVDERKMATMFGQDGYVMTDSDSLVDELIGVYREQLDLGGEHVRFE